MKRSFVAISLMVLFFLVITGCNSSTEVKKDNSSPAILGKWYSVSNPKKATIEFFQDNTLQFNAEGAIKNMGGSWLILDDGRIKIEITGPMGGKAIVLATMNGDRLLAADGSTEIEKEYVKVTNNFDYYPLKEGIYKYKDQVATEKQWEARRVLPSQVIKGESLIPVVFYINITDWAEAEKDEKFLQIIYYRKDSNGVEAVAHSMEKEALNDVERIMFYGGRHFVEFPYPVILGYTWKYSMMGWRYKIESINDEVTVEGKVYKNCVKRSLTEIKTGNHMFTEWYAPDVGLVKKIEDENTGIFLQAISK